MELPFTLKETVRPAASSEATWAKNMSLGIGFILPVEDCIVGQLCCGCIRKAFEPPARYNFKNGP